MQSLMRAASRGRRPFCNCLTAAWPRSWTITAGRDLPV
jgi:hypothetical protein